jgi:hypothetical protein
VDFSHAASERIRVAVWSSVSARDDLAHVTFHNPGKGGVVPGKGGVVDVMRHVDQAMRIACHEMALERLSRRLVPRLVTAIPQPIDLRRRLSERANSR